MPEEIDKNLSLKWLVKIDYKVQTEATMCAAQVQALMTSYTKSKIDKKVENPFCRMCDESGETMQHIICECEKPAQCEIKRRYDTVAKLVNWKLSQKHNLGRKEKCYEHCGEGVVENEDVKLIWEINKRCDMEAKRPDLILVDKKAKSCFIFNVAIPGDGRIREKEIKKI